MKRIISIALAVWFLASGCGTPVPSPLTPNSGQDASPSPAQGQAADFQEIPGELVSLANRHIDVLFNDFTLFNSWEGVPVPYTGDRSPAEYEGTVFMIADLKQGEDGIFTVVAELYGHIYIQPEDLSETLGYGRVRIITEDRPLSPVLAFGSSTVRFEQAGGVLTPLSCIYQRYSQPGLDYLRGRTEELAPVLAASQKIDVTEHDPLLVNFIWQTLLARRFIERPEDITLFDLENMRGELEIEHSLGIPWNPYGENQVDVYDPDFQLDGSLLALIPNLETLTIPHRLSSYSVFENMRNLQTLTLYRVDNAGARTLRVGRTEEFSLWDSDLDLLDLTNVNARTLRLSSWAEAIRGFRGGERLERLYMMSTRTDTRLINADNFPNLRYLNLYFYSDSPRVRDLSQLASFADAEIDLYLDYQACNNQTLESLRDVRLNELIINPNNGSYPLDDLDFSLLRYIEAAKITQEDVLYFWERTGP